MTKTRPILFSVLLDLLENNEAEEVAQDAYLKVFIAMKANKAEKPAAFLLRVAKNLAYSRLRHKKVEVTHVLNSIDNLEEQPTTLIKPEEAIDQAIQNKILIEAINLLPPACRQVFIYRKLQDKSHAEIANMMQISTKTVENQLSKGMLLCRKVLIEKNTMDIPSKQGVG